MDVTITHDGVANSVQVSASVPNIVSLVPVAPIHVEVQLFRDGKDGKSAYQIAVENGYVGSDQQWANDLRNIILYTAAENINSHTPVCLVNNLLYKMDNTNMLHQFSFVGFTETSITTGNQVKINERKITLSGWGLTPNQLYLSGPTGTIILQNNTPNSFTKVIGFAQDANTMLIYKQYNSVQK